MSELATHYPSSKGLVPIAGMAWPHLNNAIAKLEREGAADDVIYMALIAERDSRPAPIGDNNPPAPIEAAPQAAPGFPSLKVKITDLIEEARNWIDGTPIINQAQADDVGRLKAMLRDAVAEADKARIAENEPFDAGKAEVQSRYNPLIADTKTQKGSATLALEAIGGALTKWLTKLDDERRAEATRLRAEAAAAQARVQEAAKAIQSGDASLEDSEALEETIAQARAADRQANRAETARPQAMGGARVTSLRTYWVPVMVDENAALRHYWLTNREAIKDAAMALARQDVQAGKRQIPGFEIQEERRAV